MLNKMIAGVLAAGTVAAIGATTLPNDTSAQVYQVNPGKLNPKRVGPGRVGPVRPGIFYRSCAAKFSKSPGNRSYTCYLVFKPVCKRGRVPSVARMIRLRNGGYKVYYRCQHGPD